jgi:hypothetical protein
MSSRSPAAALCDATPVFYFKNEKVIYCMTTTTTAAATTVSTLVEQEKKAARQSFESNNGASASTPASDDDNLVGKRYLCASCATCSILQCFLVLFRAVDFASVDC